MNPKTVTAGPLPRRALATRVTIALLGLLLLIPALSWAQCDQPWPLRRALIMYGNSPTPQAILDQIADRFDFAVEGYRPDIEYLINRNSKFKGYLAYNSVTDNYVDSSENDWLFANASTYGIDGEDTYLHFREDTTVQLQGQNIVIPGWNPNRGSGDPPASAVSRDQARVPVYYADLRRRVANFGSQAVRDLNVAYYVYTLKQPAIGGIHPAGIMYDNAANMPLQVGVVSGGSVAEDPAHSKLNSTEFVDWYWTNGAAVFMNEMKNYVDDHPGEFGNRKILLMPNVANAPHIESSSWEDSYIYPPIGNVLSLEFEYNPTRDHGSSLPRNIYEKHTQALANGVGIFETGYVFKGRSPLLGSYDDNQAIMNTLAAHWVHRADDAGLDATTYLLGVNSWDPAGDSARWELNLAPAFDMDLGRPQGPPELLDEGTDGEGYSYQVWSRTFACGYAVVRHRDPWDGNFDEATAVTFDLGGEWSPVGLMGSIGRPVSSWTLRNGEGQIFVTPGTVGPDQTAPGAPGNLREEPKG